MELSPQKDDKSDNTDEVPREGVDSSATKSYLTDSDTEVGDELLLQNADDAEAPRTSTDEKDPVPPSSVHLDTLQSSPRSGERKTNTTQTEPATPLSEGTTSLSSDAASSKTKQSKIELQNKYLFKLTNCRVNSSRFNIHSLRYSQLRNLVVLSVVALALTFGWVMGILGFTRSITFYDPNDLVDIDDYFEGRGLMSDIIEYNTIQKNTIGDAFRFLQTNESDGNITSSPTTASNITNGTSTFAPTMEPIGNTTEANTTSPTTSPVTIAPTLSPSTTPTLFPTNGPTVPSQSPTLSPTTLSPTQMPSSSPTIFFNINNTVTQVLALQTAELTMRAILSTILSVLGIAFCFAIRRIMHDGSAIGVVSNHLRVWQEEDVLVLVMFLVVWFVNILNPVVTGVEFGLLDAEKAMLVADPCNLQFAWEVRYNAISNSCFVSFLFYLSLYCFKHLRLDMHIARSRQKRSEKRFEQLPTQHNTQLFTRNSSSVSANSKSAFQSTSVRSVSGLIPRVVLLYCVARIAAEQAMAFDMGFVPGVAWITVIRGCVSSDNPYWCEQEYSCFEGRELIVSCCIIILCLWEILLMAWVTKGAIRTWQELSTSMLLESRPQLVAYFGLTCLFLLHWVSLLFCGILLVSAIPTEVLFTQRLTYTGVQTGSSGLGILIISFMLGLSWSFLPLATYGKRGKMLYFGSEECAKMFVLKEKKKGSDDDKEAESIKSNCCSCFEQKDRAQSRTSSYTHGIDEYFDEADIESASRHTLSPVAAVQDDWQRFNMVSKLFVFETAVLLWNLSHLTYHTGSSTYRQSDAEVQLLVEDDRFVVVEQFFDELTEAYCLILESKDKIIVAFRGNGGRLPFSTYTVNFLAAHRNSTQRKTLRTSTSSSNLGTKMRRAGTDLVTPEENDGSSGEWMSTRILHSALGVTGKKIDMVPRVRDDLWHMYLRFADKVMATVSELQRQHSRVTLTTGHGIGGALAALLAFDLSVDNSNVAVYTFGMPHLCNRKFRKIYNKHVPQHFDITTHGDELHGKPKSSRYGVVHVGSCVVLDQVGNVVMKPDRLETAVMKALKSKRLNSYQPVVYILSLMQTAYRMHGPDYKPLWSSSMHELRLKCEAETLSTPYVKGYIKNSRFNNDSYLEEACLEVKVVRITGLDAQECFCVVSCGPPGVSSALWEVEKTQVSPLARSNWHNFYSPYSNRSVISSKLNSLPSHRDDSLYSKEDLDIVCQTLEDVVSTLESLEAQQNTSHDHIQIKERSNSNETIQSGVDMDELAAVPARYVEFSGNTMIFGQKQKLRPCARLSFSAIDAANGGENFGTASISVSELLPLDATEKKVWLPLEGRAHEDGVELKVQFTVRSIGGVPLENMSAVRRHIDLKSQNTWSNDASEEARRDRKKKKRKAVKLSHAMATYYLKRNFNRDTRCVVLRLGIMKASLRDLDFRQVDIQAPLLLFCRVSTGSFEHGYTDLVSNGVSPEWKAMFTFGRDSTTLTGFEDIVVELMAKHDAQNLGRAMLDDGKTVTVDSFPGKMVTAGKLLVRFSVILPKFQDQDKPIIKWLPISQSQSESSGHVCLVFEVATEPLESSTTRSVHEKEKPTWINKLNSDVLQDQVMLGKKLTTRNSKRFSSKTKALLNTPGSSGTGLSVTGLLKSMEQFDGPSPPTKSPSTPGRVPTEKASREWQALCLDSKDERTFIVTAVVHRALHLELREERSSSIVEFGSYSSTDTLKDRGMVNAYCIVSLRDLRTDAELQRANTPVIRDSANPVWEETFHFGRDRNLPVRGNEILVVSIYQWERLGADVLLCTFQVPLSKHQHAPMVEQQLKAPQLRLNSVELVLSVTMNRFTDKGSDKRIVDRSPML